MNAAELAHIALWDIEMDPQRWDETMGEKVPESETTAKRIHWMERLDNSASGNPRWRVAFTDGSVMVTEPDADANYGITNYFGADVLVTINQHGRITHLKRVTPSENQ